MTLSKSATVQPQAGFAARIWRSASPVFLTAKLQSILSPLATVPKSLTGSTMVRRGALGSAGATAAAFSLLVLLVFSAAIPKDATSVKRNASVTTTNRFDIREILQLDYQKLGCKRLTIQT